VEAGEFGDFDVNALTTRALLVLDGAGVRALLGDPAMTSPTPAARSERSSPRGLGCRRGTCRSRSGRWGYQTDILSGMDVLIRDLPDEVHTELARRAAARDMSMRAYLREVLTDHAAVPSMGEWLQRVRDLGPARTGGPTGPELVAAVRAEDDELTGR
jgi:hypothetical protein